MAPSKQLASQDLEASTDGCVNARRDYIFGLWARKTLGYSNDALFAYVEDVMQADTLTKSTELVVRKVMTDISDAGLKIAKSEIDR